MLNLTQSIIIDRHQLHPMCWEYLIPFYHLAISILYQFISVVQIFDSMTRYELQF